MQQRGHLSAHASEGQCVEYANREILAELKIESVNIMVIRRHPSTVQNKTAYTLKMCIMQLYYPTLTIAALFGI